MITLHHAHKNSFYHLIVVILALFSVTGLLAGCGNNKQTTSSSAKKTKNNHQSNLYSHDYNSKIGSNGYIKGYQNLRFPHARAVLAMDAKTGKVIYQQHGSQKRLVASTGKLMALYLVFSKIKHTPNAWNQYVHVNAGLSRLGRDSVNGGYKFKRGHKYTVGNLVKASLIDSSNNATIALAQWVAYSNKKFVEMENKQAKLWHLNATFVSPSGLENKDLKKYGYWNIGSYHEGNQMSARGLAVIAYHILHDYPQILNYSKIGQMKEDGQILYNFNELLPNRPFYHRDLYVAGLKTGWTDDAGFCFVGTAKRPHHDRIITVTLHDNHQWQDNVKLMRYVNKKMLPTK